MLIETRHYQVNGIEYLIRSAEPADAPALSRLRPKIDGETENMDREPGEAFIDVPGFERIIAADSEKPRNLFLAAVIQERIVGFSRCEGTELKRFSHKADFGVCVLKEFWGCGIGRNLLQRSIEWADTNGVMKMALSVLETNEKAIRLYRKFGFEVEGVLKNDKILSDGKYYNTVIMGRFRP
ncbi:GNAT family N-acetyltransferase [Cohnella candidum]|uniref:GNAT family N-acetyltransferase n=1 Tax=Cohnella candidum TaxID=2674991 RepID=A0A3G3JY90_9BACL|nr:GNAT family N-acetyltransferase [Cohnella candidum]AYQ72811.1 GNAT family N-acetyltransferase [Cohnella candidum]